VTDAGLKHLKGLTKLEILSLGSTSGPIGNTQVTDAGLENLKGLTKLKSLTLWGTRVTADGRKKLQESLPGCNIDR
jgi:hypothetical protein